MNTGTGGFVESRRRVLKSAAVGGVVAGLGWRARYAAGQAEDRRAVSIRDLGAIGDGRNNDRAAIAEALMSSDQVFFPKGRYFLGSTKAGENVFDLHRSGRSTRIVTEPGVTLVVSTMEPGMPNVFVFGSGNDIGIGSLEIEDLGGVNDLPPDRGTKWQGAVGIKILPGRGSGGTLSIDRIVGRKLTAVMSIESSTLTERVKGIRIGEVHAIECYYGVNCQENGDDIVIGTLTTERCRRSYFVYGVRNHRVKVVSRNGKGANADVLIKRYRFDTRDIDLTYHCEHSGTDGPGNLIALEQQPPENVVPGKIADVHVAVSVNAPQLRALPVLFRSWSPEGIERAQTQDSWDHIELEFGEMKTRTPLFVDAHAAPARNGVLQIRGARRENIGERVFQSFDVQVDRQ